jgi:hypothetical protein
MLLVGAMLLCTNTPYICHLASSCYYSDVLDRGKATQESRQDALRQVRWWWQDKGLGRAIKEEPGPGHHYPLLCLGSGS